LVISDIQSILDIHIIWNDVRMANVTEFRSRATSLHAGNHLDDAWLSFNTTDFKYGRTDDTELDDAGLDDTHSDESDDIWAN